MTFTIAPSVRTIRFHQPLALSLDEYIFTYLYEPTARSAGILTARDAMKMFQRHLSLVPPGGRVTVETTADPGLLACVDLFGQQSFALLVGGDPVEGPQRIAATFTDRGFEVPHPALDPGEFNLGPFEYVGTFYRIRPGKVTIELESRSAAQAALAVTYFPIYGLPAGVRLPDGTVLADGLDAASTPDTTFSSPRLTAKRLFASQTFHDLFRAEVFQESEGFRVKDATILFTDLKGSTQLYEQIGDLNAYALVRQHYGILSHAVSNQHGAVVKTIGDAIMATFDRPVDAVAAGLEMFRDLGVMNETSVQGALC